jgi:methylisocitrate lyase
MQSSMGKRFKTLVNGESPLQILGAINAYSAMLAEHSGGKALYLSGAGVANASYGLPDLGITSLPEVLEDVRRITNATSLPLLVDIDTGFGSVFNIARTIKLMEAANVAAIHIEDQMQAKRCGHRPNKVIVSMQEMGDRIKAAVDARIDPDFVIIARTDAFAVEGQEAALDRAAYCIELGADMIFPEALSTLQQYEFFSKHLNAPILANITEFGKTPLFSVEELKQVGVQLILYPLSAFRAMSLAALKVYQTILVQGTQKDMLVQMQTRQELYEVLKYQDFENKLDELMEEQNGQ